MSTLYNSLVARDQKSVMQTYGRYPLAFSHGKGCRLFTPDGDEYIDLLAGIAVNSLGHCPEELNNAMIEQANSLVHVSNLFFQEPQIALAEKLLATCSAGKVFFCNSGAEANEAAIKLARRYMHRIKEKDAHEVITLTGSFHGRTLATLTATGQAARIKDGFDPLPDGFVTVPFADAEALTAAVTDKTAAIMIEMIQGEGGVRPLPQEFVDCIKDLREQHGILIIVDEIQTGLCRTGSIWAHQQYDLVPDIFTSAKALANGLPMGAMLATEDVAKGFDPGSHATTFGGGCVVSAVAATVLDIMVRDNLAARAQQMGEFVQAEISKVSAAHPGSITDIRAQGLMIGIELAFPGNAIWRALLDKGFVLNLTQGNILRLLPPLIIEKADLAAFATALDEVLTETKAERDS